MKTSYLSKDVTVLLKDVTGMIQPLTTEQREQKIQQGIHYSQMLPLEYKPTKQYLTLYYEALKQHSKTTAAAVQILAKKILDEKGEQVVLVSLARAGTPIGILLKRYLEYAYKIQVPHYTISIIRGRGIDKNAVHYILDRHRAEDIQFVDGWIGKGAIIRELKKAVQSFCGLSGELAVLADPAKMTSFYGTSDDFLIPSACLNATVSGLFSRTILNEELIGKHDFHGAVYYKELENEDLSYNFIDAVKAHFGEALECKQNPSTQDAAEEIQKIQKDFQVEDINFIKPGIGETTRVLLRRVPYKILVKDKKDKDYTEHIKRLCEEKKVELIEYPLINYRACGIIKNLNADV